jgi:hypothetical protein
MSAFYIYYLCLIATGALLAFLSYRKGNRHSIILFFLLAVTLPKEIITNYIPRNEIRIFFAITDLFNLVEYTLFGLYYIKTCENKRLMMAVKLSIPLFIIFGSYTSVFVYHFDGFPVLNINTEGFILFIIYTHLLFNLKADGNKLIYMHADFWISIGILIFFGGAFVFFGLLPVILKLSVNKTLIEYSFILAPLNIILYNAIIIGLIWSIRHRRYLTV